MASAALCASARTLQSPSPVGGSTMRLVQLLSLVCRVLVALGMVSACRFAVADEGRPLKLEAVDEVIESNDRAVQSCSRSDRRLDTLAVLMQLTIDAEGKVIFVEPVLGEGEKAPAEASCLVRLSKKLKFPATGTISRVQYPFMIVSRVRRQPSF
jgi:hypothetical protein